MSDTTSEYVQLLRRLDEQRARRMDHTSGTITLLGEAAATIRALEAKVVDLEAEHLGVVATLGKALRDLSFAAQTTGGTAGRDEGLVAAIEASAQALSLIGVSRSIDLVSELRADRDRLAAEAERERLRLAACGVAALTNTRETYAAFDCGEYGSASLDDVRGAVRREIEHREERDRLAAEVERLKRLVTEPSEAALFEAKAEIMKWQVYFANVLTFMEEQHDRHVAEVAALREDAERYRAWRDGAIRTPSRIAVLLAKCIYSEDYDAAIDAARRAGEEPPR